MKLQLVTFRWVTIIVLVAIYLALVAQCHGLRFDLRDDELHFWPTSLSFSKAWWPSLDLLRNYQELNTPLPFAIFGFLERLLGGGVAVGRWANCLLSLGLLLLLCWQANNRWSLWRAVTGILIFPYFLATSILLYTDMIALFWTVLGIWSYQKGRPLLSTLSFALGLASRQYVLAFPVALLLHELWEAQSTQTWHNRRPMLFAQIAALASLLPWFLLWGGFAPPSEAIRQGLPAEIEIRRVLPENSLYMLAALGAYFVLPERLMRFRDVFYPRLMSRFVVLGIVVLAILYWTFPPYGNLVDVPTMGFLDRGLRLYFSDTARMVILFGFAGWAFWRFARCDLAGLLVLCNVLLMLKAKVAWDKYLLLLLVVLWWLDATQSRCRPSTFTTQANSVQSLTDG
jgi:hypothetical protein